jgi:hypothetical protein
LWHVCNLCNLWFSQDGDRDSEERPDDVDVAAIRDVHKRAFDKDQEGNIVDALRSNGAALLSLLATLCPRPRELLPAIRILTGESSWNQVRMPSTRRRVYGVEPGPREDAGVSGLAKYRHEILNRLIDFNGDRLMSIELLGVITLLQVFDMPASGRFYRDRPGQDYRNCSCADRQSSHGEPPF